MVQQKVKRDEPLTRRSHAALGDLKPHRRGNVFPYDELATTTTYDGEALFLVYTSTSSAFTMTISSRLFRRPGRALIVVDGSGGAGTNNITIATEGSEVLDGSATATISANYGAVRIIFDGSNGFTW